MPETRPAPPSPALVTSVPPFPPTPPAPPPPPPADRPLLLSSRVAPPAFPYEVTVNKVEVIADAQAGEARPVLAP